jgi:hypothetical protein
MSLGRFAFVAIVLIVGAVTSLLPRRVIADTADVHAAVIEEAVPEEPDPIPLSPRVYLYESYPEVAAEIDLVIKCESGWKSDAANTTSSARGLAQFLASTWVSTRIAMGRDQDLDLRFDPYEMIDTTAFLYKRDGPVHWLASVGCHGLR